MANTENKVRENLLRRMADRQGLRLERSRRRDPRATDYGTYRLIDDTDARVIQDTIRLDAVEAFLTTDKANR